MINGDNEGLMVQENVRIPLMKMQKELSPYIDKTLDSVILFKSREQKWLDKDFWGLETDKTDFIL